mmetsp:Transcript_69263/g.101505  ORF Transcript_69263/g.101505 Transcript_69263/m.101505 type:complete len:139 (+) Transcript_69263:195-611(+)
MKQDWENLGSEYEASSSVVVGDVDCTVHSTVCSKHGVSGYPTIKYYKDGDKEGQSYSGGRTGDALKAFVADTLEVKCQVADPKGCSEKEVKFMDNMKAKSAEDRQKEITRLGGMKSGSMKPELKQWLVQRQNILKQMD